MDALEQVKAAGDDAATRWIGLRGALLVRDQMILRAYEAGHSQADIATAAGISPQRVNQLVYDSTPEDENGTH